MFFVHFILIFTLCHIACNKQKTEPHERPYSAIIDHDSFSLNSIHSVSIDITEQAEALYQTNTRMYGSLIDVSIAGDSFQSVETPKTFYELANKLQTEWAIPSDNFSHPIMKFLVALHMKSPLLFKEGSIRLRNINACCLAYSFLSGELKTKTIIDSLKTRIGIDFYSLMDDPDLTIQWSDNCKTLILQTETKQKKIDVVSYTYHPIEFDQRIKSTPSTPEELEAIDKKYNGNFRLMDNALGKINRIIVFNHHYLFYKTLFSICRTIDVPIIIVTKPQSQLLYYVDNIIKALETGGDETFFRESILTSHSHLSSSYQNQIESLCNTNTVLNEKNRSSYASAWKQLQENIYTEQAAVYEQNLKKQLQSDSIDLQNITIITAKHLEIQWARDYFFLGYTQKRKPLFLSSSLALDPRNKHLVHELLSHPLLKQSWKSIDIHIPFEGGDVRAIGPFLFVGENTIEYSAKKIQDYLQSPNNKTPKIPLYSSQNPDTIKALIKNEYETLFGRECIIVGEADSCLQALMHIDMFLTFLPNPGTKPTIIVADIAETKTILSRLSSEEMAEVERSMLLASLTPSELNNQSPFWLYRGLFMNHDLIQILLECGLPRYITAFQYSNSSKELQKRLDAIAIWFETKGYTVLRAPTAAPALGYINYWSHRKGIAILQTLKDKAQRVYNNVLVEMYKDSTNTIQRVIYIPSYGIIPIEKRLVEIYNNLGYRVVFVPFMWEPSFQGGALNCLTNEIRWE